MATKKQPPARKSPPKPPKRKASAPVDPEAKEKALAVQRSSAQLRFGLRRMVRNFYDIQRLRLQAEGRGLRKGPDNPIELYPEDLAAIEGRTRELKTVETGVLRDIQSLLDTMPFYLEVLSKKPDYRGVGPTMAGVILAEFDFANQSTPSQAWSYAGLAPIPAKRCKRCHNVVELATTPAVEGIAELYKHRAFRPARRPGQQADEKPEKPEPNTCKKDAVLGARDVYESGESMRPVRGEKLRYNAFLRSKMVGVLAEVLIKLKSPWVKFYYEYKHRKQTAGWGKSDGHRDFASKRYMIKMLLLDIWIKFRTFHGLPVRSPYHEEFQGHQHQGRPESHRAPRAELPEDDAMAAEVAAELDIAADG